MNCTSNATGLISTLASISLFLATPLTVLADGAGHHHATPEVPLASSTDSKPINAASYGQRTVQAAPVTLGQPAVFGQWSDVMDWPVMAVHANLLPNGKVLAWDATPDDLDDDPHTTDNYTTRVTLWDPLTNLHTATNNDTNSDLFCAGSAHMWDGRVLFAGGDSGRYGTNGPLMNTSIYDPDTNSWRQVTNMAAPRWYSSVAALGNGELLTYAGTYFPDPIAEVFQLDETWRSLPSVTETAGLSVDYQWMQTIPTGDVMTFGPQNTLATIKSSGNGQLIEGPKRDSFEERRYGSYAMYDIGKVLVSGGTEKEGGDTSYQSAVIIDTTTNQTTDTGPMIYRRTQHNLTILADGSVLASGGNSDGTRLISMEAGVYRPEIWSPDTGQWREMNDMKINRQYHSIALLLPDGRVLSAGGGYCGDCDEVGYEEQNAEIFSPPYLFSDASSPAARPSIDSAPSVADYATTLAISSNQASRISKVHLIKPGSVTHSQNQDQRLIPLPFSQNGDTLQLTITANRNIAPPGHYMLFLVSDQGVPSRGHMIKLGQPQLTSGQRVNKPLRRNQTDEFVINAGAADKALQISISDTNANGRMQVTGVASNNRNTAACDTAVVAGSTTECRLENTTDTRWKILYTATNDSTYTLVADLSTQPDPLAQAAPVGFAPPPGTTTNSSGGGGSAGLLCLLLTVFAILRRRWQGAYVAMPAYPGTGSCNQ